ncbi:MAG: efflux RND transporter periplasmic adaptor subunit [Bacteroidota bacterium]
MSKYVWRVLITLFLIVLLLFAGGGTFAYFLRTRSQPESRPPRRAGLLVETLEAQPETARVVVKGFGAAEAKSSLLLVAQVSGRVQYLNPNLRAGSSVEKDELLVQIDPRPFELALKRAKASIAQAESALQTIKQEQANLEKNLELARQEEAFAERAFRRAQNLLETGAGTESARDQAEQAWVAGRTKVQAQENSLALIDERTANARASLAQSVASHHDAELSLEYSEIRSPFAGRVARRQVEPGQFVGIGTQLAEIYDPEVLEIPIRISLRDLAWIATDSLDGPEAAPKARAILRVSKVHATTWNGRLARIDRRLDPQSRTAGAILEVSDPVAGKVVMPGPAEYKLLTPGTFVEVEIDGLSIPEAFVLPRKTLSPEGKIHLYKDGRLEIRDVQIARSDEGTAFITGGLEAGDRIVTTTIAAPVDGMKLRVNGDEPTTGSLQDTQQQTNSAREDR